jgi:hypothetical protein
MIRIRRVARTRLLSRIYELELRPGEDRKCECVTLRRGPAVNILKPILGLGDAWSFIHEADRQWSVGNRAWAVEFEERGR